MPAALALGLLVRRTARPPSLPGGSLAHSRRRPLVVGLTGGFASGKSTVREIFRSLGAAVVDADAVARELSEPQGPVWRAVVAAFGPDVLAADGRLDRARLRRRILLDPDARRRLDAVTHPVILSEMRRRLARLSRDAPGRGAGRAVSPAVVVEVPLLFEAGEAALDLVDAVVTVWADEPTCIRRARERGLSDQEAALAIRAQWPLERKRRLADWVIDNSGSLLVTRRQVERIWRVLGSRCASPWWLTTSRSRRWSSSPAPFGRFSSGASWWRLARPARWWRRRRGS
ncbi:dephospho-CoA kinase [Geochorda subterranea]|uniref:Dephospho-CoA kinase n=1 Tax=Geochorda subterranea TaxID=3109564 RepID=A0ABZ1BS61_9FIRM|nr:dephospho-CoA kinase [Limnochorda sp. LNt]WRP15458.1 dephospho-CoA kinase [Limnochorda sp. LNt]